MSSVIIQQDGCMSFVAQQSSMGRQRQEHLEQTIALMTPRSASPDRDYMQHLQKQLAYKVAQLEFARSQHDTRFVKKMFYPICVHSVTKPEIGKLKLSMPLDKCL